MLKLDARCKPLLKGEEQIVLKKDRLEKTKQYREVGRLVVEEKDKALWEQLRTLRRTLAEAQDVPAYIIFNDKTLMEMLHHRPTTAAEFERINGVGQKKLEKYSKPFMDLLKNYAEAAAS